MRTVLDQPLNESKSLTFLAFLIAMKLPFSQVSQD